MADEFHAIGTECSASRDGMHVRLLFENQCGETRAVVIRRESVTALLALLQDKIEPGQVTPIQASHLRPGQGLAVESHRIQPHRDGVLLTLFASLHESGGQRGVTIPFPLSHDNAEDLANSILHYLATSAPSR